MLVDAILVAVVVAAMAAVNLWLEQQVRVFELDLDHWGTMVERLSHDHRLGALIVEPSMWKGPIVPFIFGLAYFVWPNPAAPLVLNVVCMGLTAGIAMMAFHAAGLPRLAIWAGLVGWAGFRPHHYVVGYYFAEPLLSLIVAMLVASASRAIRSSSVTWAIVTGVVAGTLLLSRAPYVAAIAIGIPAVIWHWAGPRPIRSRLLLAYVLATLTVWAPWPIRNAVRFHQFIPFTNEGGQVLFEGFYLAGDDGTTEAVRGSAEYQALEAAAARLPPEQQLAYWQQLAWRQIVEHPGGQLRLAVRKAIRFWTYLPDYSWHPSWSTMIAALVYLPLAGLGVLRSRGNVTVVLAATVVVSLWAVHTVLHSEMRYNVPVLPLVFVLAASALAPAVSREPRAV